MLLALWTKDGNNKVQGRNKIAGHKWYNNKIKTKAAFFVFSYFCFTTILHVMEKSASKSEFVPDDKTALQKGCQK